MREKTLLEKAIEEKKAESEVVTEKVKSEPVVEKQVKEVETKKVFSSATFPAIELEKLRRKYQSEEDEELDKIEVSKFSQVVEKPNYDTMQTLTEVERKKIFKVEGGEEANKPKQNKFKIFIISLLIALFGVWGIINLATIDNVSSQISNLTTQYELNLANYLKNLYTLDATNSENMNNLFETIPEEETLPNVIKDKSNGFDRFCNFISGLFGAN